jgi:hypothetical protein
MQHRRQRRSGASSGSPSSLAASIAARIITISFFQIVCQQFQDQIGERARVITPQMGNARNGGEFAAGSGTNFYTAWRDIAEERARWAG